MRIAVLNRDRCQPKKCSMECVKYCPKVRSGVEVISMEANKPIISEQLCVGCGICIHKCPFKAIHIENLPEELKESVVHQYGENGFRLFRLPIPKKGKVVGLLGENGIGKTTAIKILSGEIKPNLGRIEKEPSWEEITDTYRGTELYNFLKNISEKNLKISIKPQYIDNLASYQGSVKDFLSEKGIEDEIEGMSDKKMSELSGGELQKVAIFAALREDADLYLFDEPTSYLDIKNRMEIAKIIRKISEDKMVVVVEHDLAVMDFLADIIYILYGKRGVYGIVSDAKNARHGINIYLSGYLKEENVRFGDEIKFEKHPPRDFKETENLIMFNKLRKKYDGFELIVNEGKINKGEVIGIVGPNGIGKTTFIKLLAGIIEPDEGKIDKKIKISYKPQYIRAEEGKVEELFEKNKDKFHSLYEKEVLHPLDIKYFYDNDLKNLSGGELQTVAIAYCLSLEADLYLIDEPSAYLDAKQRMKVAKTIKRVMEKEGKACMVVEHDIYFVDMVSQALMVFYGEPGRKGFAKGPMSLREGMNLFLKDLEITFRRDEDSNRPRINKIDSRLDREQKEAGEYYYEI
ncbi:MAG: ribosome biogenesis/translation initiation ATPase RLI [Candidatus Thermoplasmatota archaeon]